MMIVFVVIGHAGDYDDYKTWMTKGFENKIDAEEYKNLCTDEARRIALEIQELSDTRFKGEDGLPEAEDPLKYWEEYSKITKSNTVDEYFQYEEPIGYTIQELEIKNVFGH